MNFWLTSGRVYLIGIILTAAIPVRAQYFQFSQYNFTNQRVNPAWIGTNKYMSASLISRSQSTGGDFSINSNQLSLQRPLLNRSTGRAWSGIGITFLDDRSGGVFRSEEITLSYAVNIRLSRYRILSLGFKGLYQSRRISLDGYYTGSQYVPDRGFDGSLPSGETMNELTNSFSTFSTGLYWQQVDRQDQVEAYWGLSLFDINKPNDAFLNKQNQLASTLVFAGGFRAYQQADLSIFPEVLYGMNSAGHLMNVGARWQYNLKRKPREQAHIDLLTKYVIGRSGIVGAQLHQGNFSFGLSYDFPLFVNNPSNLGALEVGVEIRKLTKTNTAKRKTKIKRKKSRKPSRPVAYRRVPVPKKQIPKANLDSLAAITPVKSITVQDTTAAPIELVKMDTSKVNLNAEAGRVSHEPMIVEKITLHFQFEFNSVDLDDKTEEFLDQLSETLTEDPALKVKITGHTDNIGSAKFNQRLSQKRAEAILNELIKKGISTDRISAEGKGLSNPITTNETEAGRSKNRRVEILLYYER
ncbi:MAG: PorP/SprF family type IX secretion system membrane protein [Bacteroidetes bacterium]|nr:PorP/SprF family type IX secretion system membrane protein [Bacteroidota bacterium]